MVPNLIAVGGSDAIYLQSVENGGLANDRNVILGEDGADLQDASCPPLAKLAMASCNDYRFTLNGDLYLPASALRQPSHS